MRIGLYGLDFTSNNLGCGALSYGFVSLLEEIFKDRADIELVCFDDIDLEALKQVVNVKNIVCKKAPRISVKSLNGIRKQIEEYKKCDVIFDFTAGDSFSEIYGKKTFYTRTLRKEMVVQSGTPLVLGSQTYGPYNSLLVKKFAAHVIKNSYKVFARDSISSKLVKEISGKDAIRTVDVAFMLPFEKKQEKDQLFRIGFNPSGLLWSGGYVGDNQFGLKFNYRDFCLKCIDELLKIPNTKIYLIAHVRSNNFDSRDNDLVACEHIKKAFPDVIESPFFQTPMEAKSYISCLDYFIGSRMHATIAAFTTKVVTIPVAYSRKFVGLYNDLQYPYIVDATKDSSEEAIEKILRLIREETGIKKDLEKSYIIAENKKRSLVNEYSAVFSELGLEND